MIAVQVEIRQKDSQDPEIDEVLGSDDKFKPGLLVSRHFFSYVFLFVIVFSELLINNPRKYRDINFFAIF